MVGGKRKLLQQLALEGVTPGAQSQLALTTVGCSQMLTTHLSQQPGALLLLWQVTLPAYQLPHTRTWQSKTCRSSGQSCGVTQQYSVLCGAGQ